MDQSCYYCSSLVMAGEKIPVPEQLQNKDKRADSAARVAVFAAIKTLSGVNEIDLHLLNIVVVNREGCTDHIQKVSAAIKSRTPAQGFFVRGGPQTLATYTALALGAHGAAFTFVGNQSVLSDAISTAMFLTNTLPGSATLLIVIARNETVGYQANTALIKQISDLGGCLVEAERNIFNHLSLAFNTGETK